MLIWYTNMMQKGTHMAIVGTIEIETRNHAWERNSRSSNRETSKQRKISRAVA